MRPEFTTLVADLEKEFKPIQSDGGVQHGLFGGVFEKAVKLMDAIKSGNYLEAASLIHEILGIFLGKSQSTENPENGGPIVFKQMQSSASGLGLNLKKIMEILGKMLPILLG